MIKKTGFALATLLVMIVPTFAQAYTLTRELQVGMQGEDVRAVQTYLATDVSIYPEGLVTGYYGLLTQAAVARFQTRNGIAAVGRIGPVTLPVINAKMGGTNTVGSDRNAPIIYSVSVNASTTGATIGWTTNELTSSIVHYSTMPLVVTESTGGSVTVLGSTRVVHTDLRTTHAATLSGLAADTLYYYMIYNSDTSGNESVTWPTSFRTDD